MEFTELRYQDPATRTYLGSPSIVRLANGDLLGTHDYFGPGCPLNHEGEEHLTSVYRSTDRGKTWMNVTHISGAFWSSLFTVGEDVYLIGCSQQYGSVVIRRSRDGGNTWSHPADSCSGLLFQGGAVHQPPNFHCAPVPTLRHEGRLYRAFEDNTPLNWPKGFQAVVVSADEDADLLDANSWTISQRLPFDPDWMPGWHSCGWLEGNAVADRDGKLWNVLRCNGKKQGLEEYSLWDRAALVRVEEGGKRLSFDPGEDFIDLPGGHTKFTIRYDRVAEAFLMLSNGNLDPEKPTNRAVLSLYQSADLRNWTHVEVLLRDDSALSPDDSFRLTGFQYVDWQFDGDDIIYLSRTAYGGAHNFHDANRTTFHRLERFRDRL